MLKNLPCLCLTLTCIEKIRFFAFVGVSQSLINLSQPPCLPPRSCTEALEILWKLGQGDKEFKARDDAQVWGQRDSIMESWRLVSTNGETKYRTSQESVEYCGTLSEKFRHLAMLKIVVTWLVAACKHIMFLWSCLFYRTYDPSHVQPISSSTLSF